MESMGDFYAIALHDPQLRAGLVAMHHENRSDQMKWARAARSSVAGVLRGLAAVVDVPLPSIPAEQLPEGAS